MALFTVTIIGIGAQELTFEVEPIATIAQVKMCIEKQWGIPLLAQQLMYQSRIPDDLAQLSVVCNEATAISFTLVVSLHPLFSALDEPSPQSQSASDAMRIASKKCDALRAFSTLKDKCGDDAIRAVMACLKDPAMSVRNAALASLPGVAERGDDNVMSFAIGLLADSDAQLRTVGLNAIAVMAPLGDARAVTCLIDHLSPLRRGKGDDRERKACLRSLEQVASKGDERAVAAVAAHTKGEGNVDGDALKTLAGIAERGDEQVLGLVLGLCEHPNPLVKAGALHAFTLVANLNDERAIAAAMALLGNDDVVVRQAACSAIQSLAACGNSKVVQELVAIANNGPAPARRGALSVLGCVAEKDDVSVVTAVFESLLNNDLQTQKVAVSVMPNVCNVGDPGIMELLRLHLESHSPNAIRRALEVCSGMALPGDARVVEQAVSHTCHMDANVRKAAIKTLHKIANAGDNRCITVLIERLQDRDVDVKVLAIEALSSIAEPGNARAIEALSHKDCLFGWGVSAIAARKALDLLTAKVVTI